MGRKNQYEPTALQRHLSEIDELNWYHEIDESQRLTFLQFTEVLHDIPELLKSQKTNYWDRYDDHQIIASIELIDDESLYLIVDPQYKSLYLALSHSWPCFWYYVKSKKELIPQIKHLIKLYRGKLLTNQQIHSYIGTAPSLELKDSDFIDLLRNNNALDKLVFGSSWKDYPFRDLQSEHPYLLEKQALRQNIELGLSYSCRTRLSHSMITIHNFNKIYTVEISYPESLTNQLKNMNHALGTDYETTLPLDVILVLLQIPYHSLNQLLSTTPLTETNLFISSLLANSHRLRQQLKNALQKIQNDKETSLEPRIKTILENLQEGLQEGILNDKKGGKLNKGLQHRFQDESEDKVKDELKELIESRFNYLTINKHPLMNETQPLLGESDSGESG